jgi:radical SAM protein with 4Fe4S-binding SPASM domain
MHATSGWRARMNGGLRLLGMATGRALVGPRLVGLEITHNCNLTCGFCESHSHLLPAPIVKTRTYAGGRRAMDLETIERLCRSLAALGTGWVELSGKGDPIVHPKLPEIIRAIKQAGLSCSMFTTGSVPRGDLAATIVDCGLDRLNLSLNAASREVWAKVAGKDLWDKTLAFLTEVLERRRRSGGQRPWVRVSFVVCKENVEDVGRSVELCRELGVDEGGWCVMGELPSTVSLQLEPEDVKRLQAGIPGWARSLDAAGIVHDLLGLAEDLPLRIGTRGAQENPMQRDLPCYEGWMHAVIAPDGDVAPCCYCEKTTLGNIVEQDFAAIWNGPRYLDLRRRMLAMAQSQQPICWECYTTCNRAQQNRDVHERLGPLRILQPHANGRPAVAQPSRA